eukprot:GHVU01196572.1.p1 GENE.GHVU01196572.1~~GHVU01196572.1.p1  ORF type:complete len:134 (+),score=8.84 GHVU01196572.1:432-833(+)
MSESPTDTISGVENIFILRGPRAIEFWTCPDESCGFTWLNRVSYRKLAFELWAVVVEDSSCLNPCCIAVQLSVPHLEWCVDRLEIEEFRDGFLPQPPRSKCESCGIRVSTLRNPTAQLEGRVLPVRVRAVWFQ